MYANFKKPHLRSPGIPGWKTTKDKRQNYLLFQMYETTSLKGVGGKGVALSNFGNEWNYKTKVKRSAHKPYILVNKAVSHG